MGDTNAPARKISHALIPVFGIRWNKKGITIIDTREIGRLLCMFRNSNLPRTDYDRVAGLFKLSYFIPAVFLPELEEWRVIADRYRLDKRHTLPELVAAATLLAAAGVEHPSALDVLGPAAFEQLINDFDGKAAARAFWRTARLASSTAASAVI